MSTTHTDFPSGGGATNSAQSVSSATFQDDFISGTPPYMSEYENSASINHVDSEGAHIGIMRANCPASGGGHDAYLTYGQDVRAGGTVKSFDVISNYSFEFTTLVRFDPTSNPAISSAFVGAKVVVTEDGTAGQGTGIILNPTSTTNYDIQAYMAGSKLGTVLSKTNTDWVTYKVTGDKATGVLKYYVDGVLVHTDNYSNITASFEDLMPNVGASTASGEGAIVDIDYMFLTVSDLAR